LRAERPRLVDVRLERMLGDERQHDGGAGREEDHVLALIDDAAGEPEQGQQDQGHELRVRLAHPVAGGLEQIGREPCEEPERRPGRTVCPRRRRRFR
jgi:hypothetical protein